ncbi:MAG: hypothetical protein NVSMB27_30630 [Ktedonobacteraceae bacterium]
MYYGRIRHQYHIKCACLPGIDPLAYENSVDINITKVEKSISIIETSINTQNVNMPRWYFHFAARHVHGSFLLFSSIR